MRTYMWFVVALPLISLDAFAQAPARQPNLPANYNPLNCSEVSSGLCPDTPWHKNYEGEYLGHDEPALLFYSNKPGSGNSSLYRLTLPKDPPVLPTQDGRGGTFEFQLNVAFWFGMILCDSQSFPNFTHVCNPDTDDNIFDDVRRVSRASILSAWLVQQPLFGPDSMVRSSEHLQ